MKRRRRDKKKGEKSLLGDEMEARRSPRLGFLDTTKSGRAAPASFWKHHKNAVPKYDP